MPSNSLLGLDFFQISPNCSVWASPLTGRETLAVVTVGAPAEWFSIHWPVSMANKYDFAIVHLGPVPLRTPPESTPDDDVALAVEKWARDRYGSVEVALVGFQRGGAFCFRIASKHPRSFEYFASHSGIPNLSDLDGGCAGQQTFLIFGGRDPSIEPAMVEQIRIHFQSQGRSLVPFQVGGARDGWFPGSTPRFLSYFKAPHSAR